MRWYVFVPTVELMAFHKHLLWIAMGQRYGSMASLVILMRHVRKELYHREAESAPRRRGAA